LFPNPIFDLVSLSPCAEAAKAPRVAELMKKFCPGSTFKVMDEGKATLAHRLEEILNLEPMIVEERNQLNVLVEREIRHKFEAYPKLKKKIEEYHDILFGKRGKGSDEAATKDVKVPLPFGFGAFKVHRKA
jgi:hypothetical protein